MGGRQRLLLAALLEAGDAGLPGRVLAQLAGPRYSEYVARLRRAGAQIDAAPVGADPSSEWRYRLTSPLPPALADTAAVPSVAITSEPVSARSAYTLIRRAFTSASIELRAQVCELLRSQPELVSSTYLRHNLGQRRTAMLDELARELGIVNRP